MIVVPSDSLDGKIEDFYLRSLQEQGIVDGEEGGFGGLNPLVLCDVLGGFRAKTSGGWQALNTKWP